MRETSANTARNNEGVDHHLMRLEAAKEHSTFLGYPCSNKEIEVPHMLSDISAIVANTLSAGSKAGTATTALSVNSNQYDTQLTSLKWSKSKETRIIQTTLLCTLYCFPLIHTILGVLFGGAFY